MFQLFRTLTYLIILLSLFTASDTCKAELKPDEIAMIVARGNRESMGLARYYCQKRGVPESNICEVDVTPGEVLDRENWKWSVRPEIQEWILDNDPKGQLRCLVTTWGIPLKIGPAKPDEASLRYRKYLEAERTNRLDQLSEIAALLDRIAVPSDEAFEPNSQPKVTSKEELTLLKQAQENLEQSLVAAQVRLAKMPVEERGSTTNQLQQLATAAGGARILLQGMDQQLKKFADDKNTLVTQMNERFNILRGRSSAFNEVKLLLDQQSPGYQRDNLALTMLQQTGGLLATVEWLEEQTATARKNETGASFDSELSLVMWQDGYELLRWQPNYLRPNFEKSQLSKTFRTLMVSRLDAPTLELAKGLIDTAIEVEKKGGLRGKVYLDARGLAKRNGPPYSPGSYPDFDRSLLITADGLRGLKDAEGQARFEVTLNEQPELFQPGQCPNAALYCGWYSLAKYVDAFDWEPGAVAYHLASAEATTLKEIDSQAWCKRLLEDGVCVTIGPVNEPYLLAFPRPSEFLALLVQGNISVVEVYYKTKPFNSWMMTLVGDPLYQPFM